MSERRVLQEGCSVHGEFDYCVRTCSPTQVLARKVLSGIVPSHWLQSHRLLGKLLKGRVTHEYKGKKNLILTQGRDELEFRAFAEMFTHCAIGDGSTAPAISQTGLVNEKFRTKHNIGGSGNTTVLPSVGASPHTFELRRRFEFPQGTFSSQTIEEVGFSWSSSSGNNLWSRALFPSDISLDSDQSLEITYRLHVSFTPTSVSTSTFTLTGHPDSPITYHRKIQNTRHVSAGNKAVARVNTDGDAVLSNQGDWSSVEAQLEPANPEARLCLLNLDMQRIFDGTNNFSLVFSDVGEGPTLNNPSNSGPRKSYPQVSKGRSGNVFHREYVVEVDDNNGGIAYATTAQSTTDSAITSAAWAADFTDTPNSTPNSDSDWLNKSQEFEMTLRFELVVSIN